MNAAATTTNRPLAMKLMLALAALVTATSVLAPASAQAGDRDRCAPSRPVYSSDCRYCGGDVYQQRVLVGYDRCGQPVYVWRTIAHRCPPPPPSSHGHSHDGHGHGDNVRDHRDGSRHNVRDHRDGGRDNVRDHRDNVRDHRR